MAKTVLNISVRIGIKSSIFFAENHAFSRFFSPSYFVKIISENSIFSRSIKKIQNIFVIIKNIILKREY